MALAAKVFVVAEERNLPLVASKLKDFKLEQEVRIEGDSFSLLSEITDLDISKESLEGTFAFDTVFQVKQHGKIVPIVRTYEAPFMFDLFGNSLFLSIFDKKSRANNIANEMSKALFMSLGQIVEGRIQPETLKRFHEESIESKIIFFDDIDLPNISKLSLYGEGLGSTNLYNDYLTHGKIWYAVVKSQKYGYVVGVTRNCVVTVFSRTELPDFKRYVRQEILPLIS
ncbi:MAG TPA: hypothetical protein VND40_05245 [Nitrososphaerales archaeon]|nr:hypothetical protein [Nitrososphaerales archaeon]